MTKEKEGRVGEKEGKNYKLPDRINRPSSPKKQYPEVNVKQW